MGKHDDDEFKSKFKKRNQSTLENTYKDRDKQSKGSAGGGKSIWDTEKLEENEIKLVKINSQKKGQYAWDLLPISFDPKIPYCEEVQVHGGVGSDNDNYICMKRYKDDKCYRCQKQNDLFREENDDNKDAIIKFYPQDRVAYLIYDRTVEFTEKEEPEPIIGVVTLPKKSCQGQIQDLVRDKKSGKIRDISDIEEDGEGQTVYFKVSIKDDKKRKFPNYESFSLEDRDAPIPKKVLKKLNALIEMAEEDSMNVLEWLFHIPTQKEIEESMKTENIKSGGKKKSKSKDDDDDDDDDEKETKSKKMDKKLLKMDIDELEDEINEMKSGQLISWAKKHGIDDIVDDDMSRREMVNAILEHVAEIQEDN
jgi:hypothetical protein